MKSKEIKKVSCVGTGVIGSSWATNFLLKGYPVVLYDIKNESLAKAKETIEANLQFLVGKGVLSPEISRSAKGKVVYTTDIKAAVEDVQFIQESGPEKYKIKQDLLERIEEYTPSSTIFSSSTSGLLISEITRKAKHPERCIGAHPYNPPHLIPLVELSKGEKTSEEAIEIACNFYKGIGKEPIVLKKEAPGFIANRLQIALYREAVDLVVNGICTVEDVDKAALFGPGLRYGIMGPNMIFHLGGGPYGIKGLLQHIGGAAEVWMEDMADWKKWPDGWDDIAQSGVKEAMLNRPEEAGRTEEEINKWRDDMLIELLRLHKKL